MKRTATLAAVSLAMAIGLAPRTAEAINTVTVPARSPAASARAGSPSPVNSAIWRVTAWWSAAAVLW